MYVRMLKQSRGYKPGDKVWCGPGGETKGVLDLWLRARIAEVATEPRKRRKRKEARDSPEPSQVEPADVGTSDAPASEETTRDSSVD